MRYLMTLSYDGSNYAGWQYQPDAKSVEEEVTNAISKILNQKIRIYASGRTDAGVHAYKQTLHFDANIEDLQRFRYSLNCILPLDIHVKNVEIVPDNFNARFDVKSKTYLYRLGVNESSPFRQYFVYQFYRKLDVELMDEAAKEFVGEHCFKNFTSKEEDDRLFIREIFEFNVSQSDDEIDFEVSGNGFMRYQVRMMVGALIEVGLHHMKKDDIQNILNKKDREVIRYKVPAIGLYLKDVKY